MHIDSNGDLIVTSKSRGTAYLIDSRALQRASPVLYEQCLAVRPADERPAHNWRRLPNWVFDGMPEASVRSTEAILNLMHANMGYIPESMDFETVQDAVYLAIQGEMLDSYIKVLRRWYLNMASSERTKTQNCCCLWLSHTLGIWEEFITLQQWAIFELCDSGERGLGDPSKELSPGQSLDLSKFRFADQVITNRIIGLRSRAVKFILTNLRKSHLAMLSTDKGHIGGLVKYYGCQTCLDWWYGCLSRGLALPRSACGSLPPEFPSLLPVIEAEEYHRPLSELCSLVAALLTRMGLEQRSCDFIGSSSESCSEEGDDSEPRFCSPPSLVGRRAEMRSMINGSLTDAEGYADIGHCFRI